MVAAMILEVVKTGEVFSLFLTGKLCYHSNAWITGVYMVYMFDRNSGGKTSQIEWLFELNLRSFSYFKCSTALWLFLDPSCKGNSYARIGWGLQAQVFTRCPKWVICKKNQKKKQKLHLNPRYNPANSNFPWERLTISHLLK